MGQVEAKCEPYHGFQKKTGLIVPNSVYRVGNSVENCPKYKNGECLAVRGECSLKKYLDALRKN